MKIQYSKFLAIVAIAIYIIVFTYILYFNPYIDSTTAMTALTVSGSVALTTIVFYMKNSWVEKVAKVKLDVVSETTKNRLEYNKEMLMFLKENNLSKTLLNEIEVESLADDFSTEATDSISSTVNSALEEASASPDIQSVG